MKGFLRKKGRNYFGEMQVCKDSRGRPRRPQAVITRTDAFTKGWKLKCEVVGALSEATHTTMYTHGHAHTKETSQI